MAYRIATANGNWTTAATWGAVDATSLSDSIFTQTTLTTAYVESQTFTPGAIVVDGFALKIQSRAAVAVGTLSARLAQGGVLVTGTEVVINVSDLPNGQATIAGCNGWIFLKFATPVTLLAATLYTVSAKTSSTNQVGLYRTTTSGNWSRLLRTTTTGAPAAGDSLFVLGEWTAAATKTDRTVTMDSTAATDYGSASTTLSSVGIGVGGTLAYATAASTAYVLRLSGMLDVYAGGTLTIGTSSAPIPRTSTAVLEFDCAVDIDFGFRLYGTAVFRAWGESRTSGKAVVQCLLNTDEAIAQTVLGVDTDTGWLTGDVVAIASTTRTATDAETATLASPAGASSLTISGGLAVAHGGTAPVVAEVILLTRNVTVRNVTAGVMVYGMCIGATSTSTGCVVDWGWVEFSGLGGSAAATGAVLSGQGGPSSVTAAFCTFRNGEGSGLSIQGTSNVATSAITLTDCVFYAIGVASSSAGVFLSGGTGVTPTLTMTRCTFIGDSATSSNGCIYLNDSDQSFTITDCRVTSAVCDGVNITAPLDYNRASIIRGCTFHSLGATSASAISVNAEQTNGLLIENCAIWRCNSTGTNQAAITFISGSVADVLIVGCTFMGNNTGHLGFSLVDSDAILRNCTFSGDSTFSTARAIILSAGTARLRVENCTFGVATGIRTAHTSASFGAVAVPGALLEITLVNSLLADATEFEANVLAGGVGRSYVARQRSDQVTNTHSVAYMRMGTVAYETTTFHTAAPSEKLTPTIGTEGTWRLRSSKKRIPVLIGVARDVSCWIYQSADYNGNAPRLVMATNGAIGMTADEVETFAGADETWTELTVTSPAPTENGLVECFVECDGTVGSVYVDDWTAA